MRKGERKLALEGGPKALPKVQGRPHPKIGVAEFMSLAERFGYSPKTRAKIRAAIEMEGEARGPYLANYLSGLAETKVQTFERIARETFGMKYAIGVSSGTGALHSAFVAAGVGPGTEVILSAIGFAATAMTVVEAGGVPIFCDVDESFHMDPRKIQALITKRTVAISPTHVMGGVADMGAIMKVARRRKLKVIEDCAQSCGGRFGGRFVGTIGDIGCFSISAYKIVGGGEGGLILTNDQRLWERANQYAEAGGLWRPDRFAPPRYEGELFSGTNYRLSELEAAVDVVQLRKMPALIRRHNAVMHRVLSQLKTYREIVPRKLNDPEGEIGYLLRFYPQSFELGEKIVAALRAEGIQCNMRGPGKPPDWHIYHHMFPVTLKASRSPQGCSFNCPVYLQRGGPVKYRRGDCPVADDLFERVIHVPLKPWYTAADCNNITKGINKVLSAYCTPDAEARAWM